MFEWLERAYTEHDPGLTQLLGTPFILNYRDDPRFAALCQKLKVHVPPTAAHEAMSDKPSFFAELKRRNVYKVAVAYAIVGVAFDSSGNRDLFRSFEMPNWAIEVFVALVRRSVFPIALILAWAFELTPEGIKLTESADELSSKPSRSRAWIYVVIIAGSDLRRIVFCRPLYCAQ